MGAGSVGHHFCVGQALFSVTRIGHLDVTSTEASGLVTPTAVARDSSCRSVSVALISRGLHDHHVFHGFQTGRVGQTKL
jgi:hypothetical protein